LKVKKFKESALNNEIVVLASTYKIIETGFNIEEANSILIVDFPFRAYSFIHV